MSDHSRIHLSGEDFFLLAFPPAGQPEGIPSHLSSCEGCRRRFAQWERAAREIAGRPETPIPDFERAVMERVRRLPAPRSRSRRRVWAAGLAGAACLAAAFWAGTRVRPAAVPPAAAAAAMSPAEDRSAMSPAEVRSAMSPADRADDALLRDVSRLVDGEDGSGWKEWAPLPPEPGGDS